MSFCCPADIRPPVYAPKARRPVGLTAAPAARLGRKTREWEQSQPRICAAEPPTGGRPVGPYPGHEAKGGRECDQYGPVCKKGRS